MRYAWYGTKPQKVKVLGTEEGKHLIEFENGATILCAESELVWID